MSLYDVADEFGNWQDDEIWSSGVKPTASQDAYIGGSSAFRVFSDAAVTVNGLGVATGDSLEIGGGSTLTATNGTVLSPDGPRDGSGIDGTLFVDSDSTFAIGNTLANSGTVAVDDTGVGGRILLNGSVAINGPGTIQLGAETGVGQFFAGSIIGGGLTNFGNTIEGAGLINVTSIDNAAGAIVAQQAQGDWLIIRATSFTNAATLKISQQATMDLGLVGATQSLTNTGTIDIGFNEGFINSGAEAALAISGNYTISGSGSIDFGGDDASIVSDLSAGDTFTNGAQSSIHANFRGEIGNGGAVSAAFNLTFHNLGDVYASGDGVTLTIDTGTNTVTNQGGLIEADDNATLILDSPTQMGQYYDRFTLAPPGGTIEATTGGTVEIFNSVANVPPSKILVIAVSSGQVIADAGSKVIVESGGSVSVPIQINGGSGALSGGVVDFLQGGAITGTVTFEGLGGTFQDNSAGAAAFDFAGGGGAILFDASGNTANIGSTGGAWDSVTGSGETVAETGALVSVVGGGNTITAGAGSIASLYGTKGDWDAVNGSGEEVALTSAQAAIDGGGVTAYANAGSAVSFAGAAGNWDALIGSGDQVTISDAEASIVGGGDAIWATDGSWASLYGTGGNWDGFTGSQDQVILTSAQAAISGGGDTITANKGSSASLAGTKDDWDAFYGSDDTVILSDAQSSILGSADTIWATAGVSASLYDTGTHADIFDGTNDALYLTSAESGLNGSADAVSFSGSSALAANGQFDAFYFGQELGVSSISGFNTSDVLHLSASDWSSFSALQASHDLFQSGANTIIQISSTDTLALLNTQLSTLSATDVKFA